MRHSPFDLDPRMVTSPLGTGLDIRHGPRDRRAVALTFDDGRDPAAVRALLAVLAAARVPATFFPQAGAMPADPTVWRSIAAGGHAVGNHTITHPDLRSLTDAEVRIEIGGFRPIADTILGVSSSPYFRPPYGSWDERVAAIAADCGYAQVLLWDIDTHDWADSDPADLTRRALEGLAGSIVLLHAGPARTALALPAIIDGYRARGLEFVTIPRLLGDTA